MEQKVIVRWRQHESGSGAAIGAAEVSMEHVNVVPNGINHEVGAMALNGVVSAVTGTKTLEDRKIERKSMDCDASSTFEPI